MNKVILMGRLTRDPEVRYTQGSEPMAIANYSLAVDRRFRREGEQEADFINCAAFSRNAEFAEKYLRKGIKVVIEGRIQTGSYTNREGRKVYTTDVIVEQSEFAESKKTAAENGNYAAQTQQAPEPMPTDADGFMSIPDDIQEELPFM